MKVDQAVYGKAVLNPASSQQFITYFEAQRENPFGGKGIKGHDIDALFGTYAQTLAFSSYVSFFNDFHLNSDALDDAELYSQLAKEFFTEEADRMIQNVYQLHCKLQRYILAGDREILADAGKYLTEKIDIKEAVTEFIQLFPDRSSCVPGYRVVAALKYACLARKMPGWFNRLVESIMKNLEQLPTQHPLEQIIVYMTMLIDRENPAQGDSLPCKLSRVTFPQNIVGLIHNVMLLQLEFEKNKKISRKSLARTQEAVPAMIQENWNRYGLSEILESYT